jgi:hypothetical protein
MPDEQIVLSLNEVVESKKPSHRTLGIIIIIIGLCPFLINVLVVFIFFVCLFPLMLHAYMQDTIHCVGN